MNENDGLESDERGWLILYREVGQSVIINDNIRIVIFNISPTEIVKIGINAPAHVRVDVKKRSSEEEERKEELWYGEENNVSHSNFQRLQKRTVYELKRKEKNDFMVTSLTKGDEMIIELPGNQNTIVSIRDIREGYQASMNFIAPKNVRILRSEVERTKKKQEKRIGPAKTGQ